MTIISWKMLAAAAIYLVVGSLGAAIEMYDEMPPGDLSLMYQDHNYMVPGNQAMLPETRDDGSINSFLAYKMLNSLRNQDVSPNAGPKWIPSGTVLVPPETFDLSLLKGNMMKRISEANGVVPKSGVVTKPAPKLNNKKEKVGRRRNPFICYFKLCAFRPPP